MGRYFSIFFILTLNFSSALAGGLQPESCGDKFVGGESHSENKGYNILQKEFGAAVDQTDVHALKELRRRLLNSPNLPEKIVIENYFELHATAEGLFTSPSELLTQLEDKKLTRELALIYPEALRVAQRGDAEGVQNSLKRKVLTRAQAFANATTKLGLENSETLFGADWAGGKDFDPTLESEEEIKAKEFFSTLVGQPEIAATFVKVARLFRNGQQPKNRPTTILLPGPSGAGKTWAAHRLAEYFQGDRNALVRIDGGELGNVGDETKLVGTGPGWVGHNDTPPLLSNENFAKARRKASQPVVVLADELEKMWPRVFNILLGVFSEGRLNVGKNEPIEGLSNTIWIGTLNSGSEEIAHQRRNLLGFTEQNTARKSERLTYQGIQELTNAAMKKKFSPEFLNRIDYIVTARELTQVEYRKLFDEILKVFNKDHFDQGFDFDIVVTAEAKLAMVYESQDSQRLARGLEAVMQSHIADPLSQAIDTRQTKAAKHFVVGYNPTRDAYQYRIVN